MELSGPISYISITADKEHVLVAAGSSVTLLGIANLDKIHEHKVPIHCNSNRVVALC